MTEQMENLPNRIFSLDVFRGLTVAAMVLVNNPGTWSAIYPPLEHAVWHGWTPTDMIFPFFLLIVGMAIPIALGRRIEEGITGEVYRKIFTRSAIIFLLGLCQMGFPFFDVGKFPLPVWMQAVVWLLVISIVVLFYLEDFAKSKYAALALLGILTFFYLYAQGFPVESFAKLRIPGVLQRIAVCYLAASLIFLWTKRRQQIIIAVSLLVFYWIVMKSFNGGDFSLEGNFAGFIDRLVIGENHIWKASKFYDPEGILSTIPAIVTTLIGVLTGSWLASETSETRKARGIFIAGIILTLAGLICDIWFPINKALWTSSFVLFMGGAGLLLFALCYWLIDIKGYRKWTKPFVIFGTNALALYFASSIFARILLNIKVPQPDGKSIHAQKWIYETWFAPLAAPLNASLIYALCYICFWLFLMWILYKKKIFIKV